MQTNLSLNSVLLKEAECLGVNVVHSAEEGIAEAVKLHKQENWLKDNAEAIASSNAYVEANGLRLGVGSLAEQQDEISIALDMLFLGF